MAVVPEGLFDRMLIRELIEGHCDAIMRFVPEQWAAAWEQDAVWEIKGEVFAGRDRIVAAWLTAMRDIEAIALSAFPGSISIDGDSAKAITHTFEHIVSKSGQARFLSGRYLDDLSRSPDGTWRFERRVFSGRALPQPEAATWASQLRSGPC